MEFTSPSNWALETPATAKFCHQTISMSLSVSRLVKCGESLCVTMKKVGKRKCKTFLRTWRVSSGRRPRDSVARPRHWIPRNKGAEGGSRLQNHFSAKRIYIIYVQIKTMLPLKEGNIFKIWTQTQINCVLDICGGDTSFILTTSTNFSTVHIVFFVQYDDTVSFMTL